MIKKDLHIKKTDESPEVYFNADSGVLKIEGRSLMEDPFSFYEGLIDWIKLMTEDLTSPITIEIYLDYFNSSSARYLLEFLLIADHKSSLFNIIWLIEENDDVMREKGQEFKYIVEMPLEIRNLVQ